MILFHQRGKAQKSFNKTKEISTYTLPDDNGTLAITENIGSTAIIALVEKPFILYPSNNSSEYNNSITISQYVNNYLYTGTKTHTTIQVSTDSNFNNIVVNNFIPDTDTNARDISLPLDYSNTTLYIRIRYHSGDYCSMWSEIVSIRTKTFIVSIPTILTPSSSLEATPLNLLITTGDFNYIGVSDTHYSTHYQVSTNEAFTSLYYNVESTTSLNSAATTLEKGVTYYIRVRYRGTKYGYSSWSTTVKVSTVENYLKFKSSTPMTITPNYTNTGITLQYSLDTVTWNNISAKGVTPSAKVIYFRGSAVGTKTLFNSISIDNSWRFTNNTNLEVIGNINMLIQDVLGGNIEDIPLASYCYSYMFYAYSNLVTAPALPSTTLAAYCYHAMFYGCTSLVTAPALPATTLAAYCYTHMFYSCSSLVTAPALPATTLAAYCYSYMFYGCTKLTTLPALPAITLIDYCYNGMFHGCTKIKLSTTKTGDYVNEYRLSITGSTGNALSSSLINMFRSTGGTFKGIPTINTTYYTENQVI